MDGSTAARRDRVTRARRAAVAALAASLLAAVTAGARAAASDPDAAAVLVVDGAVDPPAALRGPEGEARVDMALLRSLPRVGFETRTPWSDGIQRFEGARLSAVLDAVGAASYRVYALGLDDYGAELDADEIRTYPILVAWLHDGESMSVRRLGPLRIVMPFDDHPELATATGEARSVWQLIRLTVLD